MESARCWNCNAIVPNGIICSECKGRNMANEKKNCKNVPDYSQKCDLCGHSPTVLIKDGDKVLDDTLLCGPCMFGSSECLDPDNW